MKQATVILCLIFLIPLTLAAQTEQVSMRTSADLRTDQQPVHWYERGVKKQAWMALDEAAVFPIKEKRARLDTQRLARQFHDRAIVEEANDFIIRLKTPEPLKREQIKARHITLRAMDEVRQVGPVFYTDRKRTPAGRLVLTETIIVRFPKRFSNRKIEAIEQN